MSPLDLAVLEEQQAPPAVRLARPGDIRLVESADRRAHARRGPGELEWLRLVKLTGGTGFTANLIDLSEGGALLELDGPLRPGARLTLEISGAGLEAAVPLEVLRCYLADLRNGAARYRGACAFDYEIALPGTGKLNSQPAARSDGFVGADAALAYVLDRFLPADAPGSTAAPRVTLEKTDLLRVLESIHARGTKGNRDPGARFVIELLGAILPSLQNGAPRNTVMAALENQLRCWPVSVQVRLQATRIRLASLIDRCSIVGVTPAAAEPEPAEQEQEFPAGETTEKENGFQRIVVRYVDGGIVKGFAQDFHPSRPQFSLWPSINAKPSERVVVPVGRLKAIFFVRNFNGNSERQERKTFGARAQSPGRRVEVTFLDTEVILGTTLSYRPDGQGFFVIPADADGNNTRIFVASAAVRRVRFF